MPYSFRTSAPGTKKTAKELLAENRAQTRNKINVKLSRRMLDFLDDFRERRGIPLVSADDLRRRLFTEFKEVRKVESITAALEYLLLTKEVTRKRGELDDGTPVDLWQSVS